MEKFPQILGNQRRSAWARKMHVHRTAPNWRSVLLYVCVCVFELRRCMLYYYYYLWFYYFRSIIDALYVTRLCNYRGRNSLWVWAARKICPSSRWDGMDGGNFVPGILSAGDSVLQWEINMGWGGWFKRGRCQKKFVHRLPYYYGGRGISGAPLDKGAATKGTHIAYRNNYGVFFCLCFA